MKTLVTGGAGFIGSAVCRLLVAAGEAVVNRHALTYAADLRSLDGAAASPLYAFEHADIRDAAAVARIFAQHRPDRVIHLAAESHVDRSIDGSAAFVATNVVGTHVMLDAALTWWRTLEGEAKARFRFVHVSTDEVFGSLGAEGRFTEASPYDPRSPYSASKAASDHLARAWFHTYGLPVVVTNCSNNYGPFHFPEKLIPLTILNALEGRPLPVYGDGGNVRDWLYVEDHARALKLVAERGRPGETYAIGGDAERANLAVVQAICDVVDAQAGARAEGSRRGLIAFVPDRPGHDRRYAIDASKIARDLGWRAEVAFDDGLAVTVAWYLARRDWWEPLRARYAGERLGLARR